MRATWLAFVQKVASLVRRRCRIQSSACLLRLLLLDVLLLVDGSALRLAMIVTVTCLIIRRVARLLTLYRLLRGVLFRLF